MGAAADDLELLRAYEPVVRFTKGELFFPTAVGAYVEQCSLWAASDAGESECLVASGGLDLSRLARESAAYADRPLSLRFVQLPLDRGAYRRWRHEPREHLAASARFTTTGMFGRLVDAGFRGSLLLRGKVAAGLAAAAQIAYAEHLEPGRFPYYGRVVRDGGYVCLQYWFFYAMNDWRSTFAGVNDHEADWELAVVYLAEQPGAAPEPAWVAFSSHDHRGDDLRRAWDDPGLRRVGDHPVLFAGAGSHSGAFVPGDYVVAVDPPRLREVIAVARRVQRHLAPWREQTQLAAGFGIPFVDYARGDGREIGPNGDGRWSPELIGDDTTWVREFRGLWGLDTEDRFGGERAPAGPRYERDGSVRSSWANPLGWAGLLKVSPTADAVADLLAERIATLTGELDELDARIASERRALRGLPIQARSLAGRGHTRAIARERLAEADAREAELNRSIATRTRLAEERRVHVETLSRPFASGSPPARSASPRGPRADEQQRRRRFLGAWSAISTPLLLAAVVVVFNAGTLTSLTTIAVLAAAFSGVEAFARRRFVSFAASAVLLAAAIALGAAVLLLFRDHWRLVVSAPLAVAALALLLGNVRDRRHGWRRGRLPADSAAAPTPADDEEGGAPS